MRRVCLVLSLLAILSTRANAGDPISLFASKTRWLDPIPEASWVGRKVIFMVQRHGVRGEYAAGMPRDKFVGRTATVKGFENAGQAIVLEMTDDRSVVRMPRAKSVFRDLLLLDELERARKTLKGKSYYEISNFSSVYVWNAARQLGEAVEGPRFVKWQVMSVDIGEDNDAPLRVKLRNPKGDTAYWQGSISNTNRDPAREYDFLMFERSFDPKDPKTVYNFPDSVWTAIGHRQLLAGMTELQVILSKGKPPVIHDKSYREECDVIWSYFDDTFLCLKDGRLVSWEMMSVGIAPGE